MARMWQSSVLVLAVAVIGCGSDDGDAAESDNVPAVVTDECITDGSAGDHVFVCDGITFDLHVPPQCLRRTCGVILDVHGWMMKGPDEEREAKIGERGAAKDFVVIQPTANIGPAIGIFPEGPSWNQDRDFPLLDSFLMRTLANYHLDDKRVFVTGFSQGGSMTWRFLCERSDLLAAVAPGAANAGAGAGICAGGTSMPNRIPILYHHGTRDALVPFAGAEATRDTIVQQWGMREDQVISSDAEHKWTRYIDDQGGLFEFAQHDYATSLAFLTGHCFPGSDVKSTLACKPPNAFVWGEAVVNFFAAHPKP